MIIDLLITILTPFLALVGSLLSKFSLIFPAGVREGLALLLGNLKYAVPFFPVADLVAALTIMIAFEYLVVGYLVVRFFINLNPFGSKVD